MFTYDTYLQLTNEPTHTNTHIQAQPILTRERGRAMLPPVKPKMKIHGYFVEGACGMTPQAIR